ncbi:uncharacterized protein FOMMEDRAFT_171649 [Fomitiporia mediterranea MF3/22]|uniref:Uncharacterized protein n=1 Tax=Fomitiporia mediterranea (strain MF3/22) TaxID=694068 RepID=R7SFE1_FOMME|nr:uncharacterized protein FOMMEDRAFT_171649 [Fomitiporia mediterranea MF3/22]EJC97423.1 hypothetical protein FOMMEDRAFT_171649 [Fomitiporia mediterranea MF3/22]
MIVMIAMPRMYLTATTLLLLSQTTSAAHKIGDFESPSWSIGDLVFDGLYILIYLACTIFCITVAKNLPNHRASFITLLGALSLAIAHLSLLIAFRVIYDGSPSIIGESYYMLQTVVLFFRFWSYDVLYVALGLVLLDRRKSALGAPFDKQDKIAFGVLFGAITVFAVFSTTVPAVYAADLKGRVSLFDELVAPLGVFSVTWAAAAVAVGYVASYVNKRLNRAGIRDKISRLMLVVITPFSALLCTVGVIMTWLPTLVMATLFVDGFFCAITITLLIWGMKPEYWYYKSE